MPRIPLLVLCFIPFVLMAMGPRKPETTLNRTQAIQAIQAAALFLQLAKDEKQVDLLLVVKTANPRLDEEIQAIASTFSGISKTLDSLDIDGKPLADWPTGLPAAEVAARATIKEATAKHLITVKGRAFDLALISTQESALAYSLALINLLKSQSESPVPAAELKNWEPVIQAHLDRLRQLQVEVPAARP